MSGSTPYFPRIVRQLIASYDDGQPVSAWEALVLRSNLQLWIANTGQTLVNWSTPALFLAETFLSNSYGFSTAGVDGITRTWAAEFVHGWMYPDWPNGLEIEAKALVGPTAGADLQLDVRVVPAKGAPGNTALTPYFEASGQTTGGDTTVTVGGVVIFDTPVGKNSRFIGASAEEFGILRTQSLGLSRIECKLTIPEDDGGALISVYVREFACLP